MTGSFLSPTLALSPSHKRIQLEPAKYNKPIDADYREKAVRNLYKRLCDAVLDVSKKETGMFRQFVGSSEMSKAETAGSRAKARN